MAVTVKAITLWRREIQNRPGALADALAPLSHSGSNLSVLMAYRFPGDEARGAVELFPVSGKRAKAAAGDGGFGPFSIPALRVEGDDAPGLGAGMTRAIAEADINLAFVVMQSLGRRFAAVVGFDDEDGARRAVAIIRKAAAARAPRRTATRKRR
jgi:hypothetical protein